MRSCCTVLLPLFASAAASRAPAELLPLLLLLRALRARAEVTRAGHPCTRVTWEGVRVSRGRGAGSRGQHLFESFLVLGHELLHKEGAR
eukprot:135857-Rhodomonas_salina.1